jgi:hypothetical protein
MSHDYMLRRKDEFFLAAKVRPAAAEHYVAWLEAYLDAGNSVESFVRSKFSEANFVTMSADCKIPKLEGDIAVAIIVPPGINANDLDAGDNRLFFVDGARKSRYAIAEVWSEMLDMLIGDGYGISRLISDWGVKSLIQEAIIDRVTRGQTRDQEFYKAFRGLSFSTIDAGLNDLRDAPAEDLLRDILKLKPETAIDAKAQSILDAQKQEALNILEILHYKLDPANQQPIAAFGKKARRDSAKEPSVELADGIQVGPPLKYKEPGP